MRRSSGRRESSKLKARRAACYGRQIRVSEVTGTDARARDFRLHTALHSSAADALGKQEQSSNEMEFKDSEPEGNAPI